MINELQLENWIETVEGPCWISAIHNDFIEVNSDGMKWGKEFIPSIFRPAKISKNWLFHFGFDCEPFFNNMGDRYVLKHLFNKDDFYIDGNDFQPYSYGKLIAKYDIEYVHQLQNLFQSLYGRTLFSMGNKKS